METTWEPTCSVDFSMRNAEMPTDRAPMVGDDFWTYVKNHLSKLYNFAWRLAGNEADAADLLQEALARAFEARHRYDPTRPFDAWVGRILHNHFLDNTRRYDRRHGLSLDAPLEETSTASLSEVLAGDDPNPVDSLLQRESHAHLRRCLSELPPVYRSAVILCDMEGYSYETMADILDCPIGTVRSRIHQGRRLLRASYALLTKGETR